MKNQYKNMMEVIMQHSNHTESHIIDVIFKTSDPVEKKGYANWLAFLINEMGFMPGLYQFYKTQSDEMKQVFEEYIDSQLNPGIPDIDMSQGMVWDIARGDPHGAGHSMFGLE